MNRSCLCAIAIAIAIAIALTLTGCGSRNPRVATTLNNGAVLKGELPVDPLGWRVITSGINPADATMSTLFGNDSAVEYCRTRGGRIYPAGSVLSLVTWRQQEDSRWFGARIPAQPRSVEVVKVEVSENARTNYVYQDFEGVPLREVRVPAARADERVMHLLSQRAAVMP
ncbi:MAG: cytochrome P460 family protein [Bryobacteraceae bacterium]